MGGVAPHVQEPRVNAVPMRLADSVFTGEIGASRFLRLLPCFVIAPVTMQASSWRAIVAARGRGTAVEPLLPVGVLRRVVNVGEQVDSFRARGGGGADGGVAAAARRAKSFAAVEHTLAPEIARWCRRFVRGGGVAGEAVDVALMGGQFSRPPSLLLLLVVARASLPTRAMGAAEAARVQRPSRRAAAGRQGRQSSTTRSQRRRSRTEPTEPTTTTRTTARRSLAPPPSG